MNKLDELYERTAAKTLLPNPLASGSLTASGLACCALPTTPFDAQFLFERFKYPLVGFEIALDIDD